MIKFLTTGGTIDKIYYDDKDDYHVGEPEIGTLLNEANVTVDFSIESILRKDSLHMTDEDRETIRDAVNREQCPRIVITHGTDGMASTGRALFDCKEKTIVLTGSMRPAKFRNSDAAFNIGFATAAVQLAKPGVYIAVNGRLFDPATASKDVQRNIFVDASRIND